MKDWGFLDLCTLETFIRKRPITPMTTKNNQEKGNVRSEITESFAFYPVHTERVDVTLILHYIMTLTCY